MKNRNSILILIIVAIVVGAAAFFGGMQYQKIQRGNFQGRFGATGQQGRQFGGGQGGFQGARPVNGEIISQDDKSVTVKMQDGSTKIVILSDKTTINKASAGTKADLKTGETIAAFGSANSDGSITAQMISIGGAMFRFRGSPNPSGQPANQ